MGLITDRYGELVFTLEEMEKRLGASTYRKYISTLKEGAPLDPSISEDIARAMKEWATEKGATHFTHWFQPQRNGTAEKHDSFISYGDQGEVIEKFSSKQLIQSEPDASSFPSGGIRSTFEARGYTAWDPTSPAFLRDAAHGRSLVIPSIYMSWTGEALDMKTPLLRSVHTLGTYALKLQRMLGNRNAKRIVVYAGMEQEYFLIPLDLAESRKDIKICGRTLFGAPPVKGQSLEDHYFGAIPESVMAFMNELDQELYRFGIPVKTKHNEVAPNQFELAPLFEEIHLGIDHNLQIMDIMTRIGKEHGFEVLLHEKPFARLNGSGKHMNWSIGDNTGANYLEPSKSPLKNISFLLTLGALIYGLHKYSGILRASIADAGNEHRLGSHEAPPAILSVYLGDYLSGILDHIEGIKKVSEKDMSEINLGLQNMPKVMKDLTDRNRTSPFAFTGNKFEFRAVGSSANGSRAATAMNIVCAYGYQVIIERLEKMNGDVKENAILVLKDIFKESKNVRFEGNGYSEEWQKEARKRGLFMTDTTPEAIEYQRKKEAVALFEEMGIFTKREIESRVEIQLDAYSRTKYIEMSLGADMVKTQILPSLREQMMEIGGALSSVMDAGLTSKSLVSDLKEVEALYSDIQKKVNDLLKLIEKSEKIEDSFKRAQAYAKEACPQFEALRKSVDQAEALVSEDLWRLPSYDDLLLSHS